LYLHYSLPAKADAVKAAAFGLQAIAFGQKRHTPFLGKKTVLALFYSIASYIY
jgi:hypothetical protein